MRLPHIYIPTSLLVLLKGRNSDLVVLLTLTAHQNTKTKRTQFMSKPEIAKISGISRRHTYSSIDRLVEDNLIEPIAERRGEYMYHLSFYDLLKPESMSSESEKEVDEAYKDSKTYQILFGNGGEENG